MRTALIAISLAFATLLSACGGGGDEECESPKVMNVDRECVLLLS